MSSIFNAKKDIVKRTIDIISRISPAICAGGYCRDTYLTGQSYGDMDFYSCISKERVPDLIKLLKINGFTSVEEKQNYDGIEVPNLVSILKCIAIENALYYDVDIILVDIDPIEYVKCNFSNDISKIYFDGSDFVKTEEFERAVSTNTITYKVICKDNIDQEIKHYNKLSGRSEFHKYCFDLTDFIINGKPIYWYGYTRVNSKLTDLIENNKPRIKVRNKLFYYNNIGVF